MQTSPCALCPRRCGAQREKGERGFCGADDRVLLARAALHFWEEPPLSGERGSGALFFTYCPLRCVYCQNHEIAAGGAGVPVSVEQLAGRMIDLQRQGAININCVTPTHYAPWIAAAVQVARRRGLDLPIVWNTSGYERSEIVKALDGCVDIWLTDFKYAASEPAARYSNAPDYPEVALAALDAMVEQAGPPRFDEVDGQLRMLSGVVVRHLLLPGSLHDSMAVVERLHGRYGNRILYSLMNQYTPVLEGKQLDRFPELGNRVPDSEYEALLDFADALGMEDYYWQDGPAALESFIPVWDLCDDR